MSLSVDLIDQFVDATNDEKKETSDGVAYGTVVKDGDAIYVQLDGSTMNTPVTTTTNVQHGERVAVLIKNHTATITGNFSSPAARTEDVESANKKITEFEIAVGKKLSVEELTANSAFIKFLLSDEIVAETIRAANAKIDELEADKLTVEDLKSIYGDFESLEADLAKLGVTEIDKATIKDLNVITGHFRDLDVDYATFKELVATKAEIDDLVAKTIEAQIINGTALDVKYANVEFANIKEEAVEKIFAGTGLIDNLTVGDGMIVSGDLCVVTLNASNIKSGTMTADRLLLKDDKNGLYYQLNLNALGETFVTDLTEEEQLELQNGIHGENIIANSITAKHIVADDLTAFGATIANFHIVPVDADADTPGKLYSDTKDSPGDDTRGVYMDTTGQFAVGDSNNTLKFFKDTDGKYKLAIKASEITLGGSDVNESIANAKNSAEKDLNEVGEKLIADLTKALSENAALITALNGRIEFIEDRLHRIVTDENGTTLFQQSGDGYTFSFYESEEKLSDLDEDMIKALEHRGYITFNKNDGDPYILIQASEKVDDCLIKLKLDNSKMAFLNKTDDEIGAITADTEGRIGITVDNETVTGEFRQSNQNEEHGEFVWQVRPNGNYGLSWKG